MRREIRTTPEQFRDLTSRFDSVPRERLADVFLINRETLYNWEKKGIPHHNKYANMMAKQILKALNKEPDAFKLDKLLEVEGLISASLYPHLPPTCIVALDGVKCNKTIVLPTLLCSAHLNDLYDGKEFTDIHGEKLTLDFIRNYENWSHARCAALRSKGKETRCRRYAVKGSQFCPIHKQILAKEVVYMRKLKEYNNGWIYVKMESPSNETWVTYLGNTKIARINELLEFKLSIKDIARDVGTRVEILKQFIKENKNGIERTCA